MLWCGVPKWHKLRIVITEHLFDLISMKRLFVILSEICCFLVWMLCFTPKCLTLHRLLTLVFIPGKGNSFLLINYLH